MSLKTHPSAMNKIVKFDEHKLLHNQIDRLRNVSDGMNIRVQCRKTQQSRPCKPYIHGGRGRGYRQFPNYNRGRGNYRQRSYDRNSRRYFFLDPNPEDSILQKVPITGRTITIIEITADSPEVVAHPDLLQGGPELNLELHQVGTMTDALATCNLIILPESVLKMTLQYPNCKMGKTNVPDTKTILSCMVVNQMRMMRKKKKK